MVEFLALKQGNNTVLQYAQTFNQLSQYGGFHVDTDEKKQDCFRRGLSTKLQDKLALTTCNNFTELVNKAITQEDATLAHKADKKERHLLDPPAMHPRGTSWFRQEISRLQTVLHSRVVGSLGHHSNSSSGHHVPRHSSMGRSL